MHIGEVKESIPPITVNDSTAKLDDIEVPCIGIARQSTTYERVSICYVTPKVCEAIGAEFHVHHNPIISA